MKAAHTALTHPAVRAAAAAAAAAVMVGGQARLLEMAAVWLLAGTSGLPVQAHQALEQLLLLVANCLSTKTERKCIDDLNWQVNILFKYKQHCNCYSSEYKANPKPCVCSLWMSLACFLSLMDAQGPVFECSLLFSSFVCSCCAMYWCCLYYFFRPLTCVTY